MRTFMVPVAAALSLIALPALAAGGNGSSASGNDNAPNATPQSTQQIQQDLHQSLAQAGFTDIKIIPGSFLVHAKDKKGNPVEMMINPNSVVEIAAIPGSSNGNQNGSHNGNANSGQSK